MVEQLIAFVLTCLVVVLVPGPDFALVLRNAARSPRAAATAAAGIMVGNTILAALAVLGVTALLGASEAIGTGIRIALAWYVLLLSGLKKVTAVLARPRTNRIIVGGSGAVLAGVGGTILTKTLVSA